MLPGVDFGVHDPGRNNPHHSGVLSECRSCIFKRRLLVTQSIRYRHRYFVGVGIVGKWLCSGRLCPFDPSVVTAGMIIPLLIATPITTVVLVSGPGI